MHRNTVQGQGGVPSSLGNGGGGQVTDAGEFRSEEREERAGGTDVERSAVDPGERLGLGGADRQAEAPRAHPNNPPRSSTVHPVRQSEVHDRSASRTVVRRRTADSTSRLARMSPSPVCRRCRLRANCGGTRLDSGLK